MLNELRLQKIMDCSMMEVYRLFLDNEKAGEITIYENGEIWCHLLPEFRNQGVMTRALKKLIKKLPKGKELYAIIKKENRASQKMIQKVKFEYVGEACQNSLCFVFRT